MFKAKKCGLSDQQGLKNDTPAPTTGPHIGECGKSMGSHCAVSRFLTREHEAQEGMWGLRFPFLLALLPPVIQSLGIL